MSKTISDRMADASQADHGLPYSLICDAWKNLDLGDMEANIRAAMLFLEALTDALDAYEADPAGYPFNPAAYDVSDTPVDPAAISEAVIGVPAVQWRTMTDEEG